MVVARFSIILLLILIFPNLIWAKTAAQIDRATIEEGETFQLTIQTDGDEPDLSKLNQDFDVLGTSRSSKVSIINGAVDRNLD